MKQIANGTRMLQDGMMVTHLRSSDGATAMVADHGAHLLGWCPAGGTQAIFLSTASRHGPGEAIRGGVPIIFPQFGERGPGKRHGIARVQAWQFLDAGLDDGVAFGRWALQGVLDRASLPGAMAAATDAKLEVSSDTSAKSDVSADQRTGVTTSAVPGGVEAAGADSGPATIPFTLGFQVRLAGDLLELTLEVDNPSPDQSLHFQAALHTYLRVDDIDAVALAGLQDCSYLDQARQDARGVQPTPLLRFEGEVDRLYAAAPASAQLQDGPRRVDIAHTGFCDTVVWNPGADKAAALADLQPGGMRQFVCVEAGVILNPVALAPGARWRGMQSLTCRSV